MIEPATVSTRPYWISLTVIQSIVTVAVGTLAPPNKFGFDLTSMVIGVFVMAMLSAFIAYTLPAQSVWPFASLWRLPTTTLLLTRPMVKLIGSAIAGNLFGFVFLALFADDFYWLAFAGLMPSVVLYFVSATRRLRRDPKSEFSMPPPFPYPIGRRMRR